LGVIVRERVYVALGSNVGERAAHLAYALARLAGLLETRLVAVSRIEETAPLGPIPQGPYLNQMVLLETGLDPATLLRECRAIEIERGRDRAGGGGHQCTLGAAHPGSRHRAVRRSRRAHRHAHHPAP
jgi:2-amino-4-hydroxy-6-hydroxymethyldihydropteridine diphosphokinase